jgi:transposase
MKQSTATDARMVVGLDLGDRYSRFCILDPSGEVTEEGRIATTEGALRRKFENTEPLRVIFEVGTHSAWVDRLLQSLGHETIVANAGKVALIYKNTRKRDSKDAHSLAELGLFNVRLLHPIQHRSEDTQVVRGLVRSRDALVRSRTLLINHVRGTVKTAGARLPSSSSESFPRKVAPHIPEELKGALSPLMELITQISKQIQYYDRRLERIASEQFPETELLRQVPGVGPLTALWFILTVEDPARFSSSRWVGPFLGLVPRLDQSGEQDPQKGISKAGDTLMRKLLVGAGHYILGPFGPDTDLRRWGLRIAARGGKNAKKRAVVAVARKLAVLLHSLWVTAEVYEPLRNSKEGALAA